MSDYNKETSKESNKLTIEEEKVKLFDNLIREYSLKLSVNNPYKNSPNVFLNKLMFRIHNYYKEFDLSKDPLII